MLRAPAFWKHNGLVPRLLAPLACLTGATTAVRLRRKSWYCPVPVICIGNVTLGGAGKTTVGLELARRLLARGWGVQVLLRGYGRASRGLRWVEPDSPLAEVGDEALLYAPLCPTWVCADRKSGAQAMLSACAEVVLMDDGLQNPGVEKQLSLLVIDGTSGFGNGYLFPAGPLREPVDAAARRCHAAILIDADETGVLAKLPPELPVLRAKLTPGPEAAELAGRRVLGFAGIALPDKFFATLREVGAEVVARRSFPDHHPYTEAELAELLAEAKRLDALPVTTAKDSVRLAPEMRRQVRTLSVTLSWEDPEAPESLLRSVINRWASEGLHRRTYDA
jgi:tetraacyldisaccharide 4'-kinase